MRLLNWNEKEQYKPLERGNAFVQYYENGDKYDCHSNPFNWNYHFWYYGLTGVPGGKECPEALMGGEL